MTHQTTRQPKSGQTLRPRYRPSESNPALSRSLQHWACWSLDGDSYDNALVESFNGLYEWGLTYPSGAEQGLSDVEFATLEYVD